MASDDIATRSVLNLESVRRFVVVAEECHFGRAAERLHMAQPPLSQTIRQLECDLLPSLARVLRAEFPGLQLDLKCELLTPDQVAGLLDKTLDLGFLRPPVRHPDIELRVLRREPLIAVLPTTHPLAARPSVPLAELRDEPFISYPSRRRSVVYDAVLDACASAGFAPVKVQEVKETATLVSFVAAGLGVALVPASVQHLRITGATYLPLAGVSTEVELALATRAGDASPRVIRVRDRAVRLIAAISD